MNLHELIENSYRLPSYQRLDGMEARLDGISFSFNLDVLSQVQVFIENLLPAPFKFKSEEYGTRWYKNLSTGSAGASLSWEHRQGYALGLCQLGGEFFSHLDAFNQKKLIDFVAKIGAKTSFIALDIDDYTRKYSPDFFLNEWESGRCTGFRAWEQHNSFSPAKKHLGYGDTISFGRRGNHGGCKRFSCYDKYYESVGALNCYRYELSLYKIKAQNAVKNLSESPLDNWHHIISSMIQGEIKFEGFNISDETIFLGCKKPKNSLHTKLAWLKKQVAPTFAALHRTYEENDLDFGELLADTGQAANPQKVDKLVEDFRNFYG